MDSDRFLRRNDEEKGLAGPAAEKEGTPSPENAGATGLFGVVSPEPPKVSAEQAAGRPLPVVHSVIFKADSSRTEGTDQLMNILRSPALNADAAPATTLPPTPTPPPAPAPPPGSSGGFTQLLRALNYDQVKEPSAPGPAKATESSATAHSPAAASPAVTSFQTQPVAGSAPSSFTQLFESVAPAREPAVVAAPSAPAPGSFTQMFRALDAAPPQPERGKSAVVPETSASVAEPIVQPAPAAGLLTQQVNKSFPPAVETERVDHPPSGPGSFTQMFAAVSSPPSEPLRGEAAPATPEPIVTSDWPKATEPAPIPGSFTQMFRALDAAPTEAKLADAAPLLAPASTPPMPAGPEASAPGSFTQMFRALDAASPETAKREGSQPSSTVAPVAPKQEPGSFTQMFRALDAVPNEPARMESQAQLPTGGPGSFTQMFSTPAASPLEAGQAESPGSAVPTPGSFTQMFQTPDAGANPSGPPVASAGPPNNNASQVFATARPRQEQAREDPPFSPFDSVTRSPLPTTAAPSSHASAGGLTQLLRALDQPPQTPPRSYPPSTAAQPAAAESQQPGAFTAMYGTLREEAPPLSPPASLAPESLPQPQAAAAGQDATQAFRMPQGGAAQQAVAPVEAGPSEFTRILNASTLRESALRGGGQPGAAEAPPAGPPPSNASAPPQWAMPQAPTLPTAPQVPHAPQPPQVPKLPEAKLPEIAKAPAGQGMQQYLPLLLILVIFLLLAILVAVIFLMKK